jgi:nitrilase
MDEVAFEKLTNVDPGAREILSSAPPSVSMIIGPTGDLLTNPVIGKEGMVFADIDLSDSIVWKEIHDINGGYNRFDIFKLQVNTSKNIPVYMRQEEEQGPIADGEKETSSALYFESDGTKSEKKH